LGQFLGCLGMIPCCCCRSPYKRVQQGNVGLVSEFGRFTRMVEPGLTYVNPLTETMVAVNMRMRVQALPVQTIFTRDNVSAQVDSVLYWRVADAPTSVYSIEGVERALVERALTTMREICSIRDLQDILNHREVMAEEIKHLIEGTAQSWGIEIESILIKDILLSPELKENLSAAAVAKRQGASKVISAQAEVEAARLMREASDILASPAAMQFRYLDTLQKMSQHANSRVIFMPTSAASNQFSAPAAFNGVDDGALRATMMSQL